MPSNCINTDILDTLIVGRVEPHIYAFTTETIPNYLKIGDTYRPVSTRIKEWSNIYKKLKHIYTHSARIDDDTIFRDHAVHDYLETEKSKVRLQPADIPDSTYYSCEFFKDTSTGDIDEAIENITQSANNNDGRYKLYSSDHLPKTFTYTRGKDFTPRENQQEVIDNFRNAVDKGRTNLLMFAVMRFGKSFTSLCCAKEIDVIDRNDDNKRIARNLGLSKKILSLLQTHLNGFSLRSLDYKIQNTNSISRDNSKTAYEKVKIALTKFGRMSESEIITPIQIADEMVSILPNNIFQKGPILDIASKQGEFTFALIKRFGEESHNMIYSLCTSPLAYEFTRKVYSLLSLPIENVYASNYSSDLINSSKTDFRQSLIDMNFSSIIGNPPYNELIGTNDSNRSPSKQQFPSFVMASVDLGTNYVCMITPSRWFTGDAQDKSFVKLRQYVADNNHISDIINYPNTSLVFDGVNIIGGVNYFLYDRDYKGNVNFVEVIDKERFSNDRPLFEDGMDIIFGSSRNFAYVNKIKRDDFVSLNTITQGRDAFGIVGKGIESRSSSVPFDGSYSVRCKYEEIRYIDSALITRNKKLADKWKIFISKSNGGAGLLSDNKQVAILGIPYIAEPHSVCTDSLIPIGCFDSEFEAKALWKYLQTRFVRFLVGILKTSQNLYQPVYQFVPMQDFTDGSDIDWCKSIAEIDKQLYAKYNLTTEEIAFIEAMIKPM